MNVLVEACEHQLANVWYKRKGKWYPLYRYTAHNVRYDPQCVNGYHKVQYDCREDGSLMVDHAFCNAYGVTVPRKRCIQLPYDGGNTGYNLWSKSGGGGWRTNHYDIKMSEVIGGWTGPGEYDVVLYWLLSCHNYKSYKTFVSQARINMNGITRLYSGVPATTSSIDADYPGVYLCAITQWDQRPCARWAKWDGTMVLPDSDGGSTSHWVKHIYTPFGSKWYDTPPSTIHGQFDVWRYNHGRNDLSMLAYRTVLINKKTFPSYTLPQSHF